MAVVIAAPIEEYPPFLSFSTVPTVSPSAAPGFPASNLLSYDPTKVFKSSTDSTTITWDFGSTREFDVVSLIWTNSSYQGTMTIEGSNDGSAWTTLKASHPIWAHLAASPGAGPFTESNHPAQNALDRNLSFWLSPTVQSWRYIRVSTTDAGVTNATFGRLFVGKSFQPSRGIQYGSAFNFTDQGRRERTDRGALVLESAPTIVSANLKMDFLTKDEMYDFMWEFNFWRGGTRELLACLDTTDIPRLQKNTLYCTIAEGRQINFDAFNMHSQSWILESIA